MTEYKAHYPGDVRESELICGLRTDGTAMVASTVEYDEATNRSTVYFEPDPSGQMAAVLTMNEQMRKVLPQMFPAFFVQH